jgi:L-alanine-DL-glutamate epimerase-like enolase superfamily enzyme
VSITSVEAVPVAIRDRTERELAYGKIFVRRNVVIRIRNEDGQEGVAETTPIPIRWGCEETQESIVSTVEWYIAPLLIGEDPTRINHLLDKISARVGTMPYARAGVCDALYDLSARLAGVPISRLLGGIQSDRLLASHSISFKSAEEMAKEAAWAVSQGAHWIKVKIGSRDPEQDCRNVAAVREAVGPHVDIHVDANAGYRYLDAIDVLPRIEASRPRLIEQPVGGWDIDGMCQLRRKLRTPLMADESVRSLSDLREIIRKGAADAILMKLVKHGGIRDSQRIADLASASGIAIYPSTHMTTSIGVATSVQFYATVPDITPGDFHAGPALLVHDLVRQPILPVEGGVAVSMAPGNGIVVDGSLLAQAHAEAARRPAAG